MGITPTARSRTCSAGRRSGPGRGWFVPVGGVGLNHEGDREGSEAALIGAPRFLPRYRFRSERPPVILSREWFRFPFDLLTTDLRP